MKMKKAIKQILSLLLVLLCLLCLFGCSKEEKDLWENALYTENTTLGEGEKTITVEVEAADRTVTFTVKTNKKTVGEALMELGLLTGEDGDYGLYIKTVNGILADYDKNQRYWAFYIDGEYAMTGADGTEIAENVTYRFEYAK